MDESKQVGTIERVGWEKVWLSLLTATNRACTTVLSLGVYPTVTS